MEFAIHDLGASGVGALLVYQPDEPMTGGVEHRLPTPPPLDVRSPVHLAPLRHVLSQVDGAALFDAAGILRHLGVRLVPSANAEASVDGFRGTRHTSARRYSFDHPDGDGDRGERGGPGVAPPARARCWASRARHQVAEPAHATVTAAAVVAGILSA